MNRTIILIQFYKNIYYLILFVLFLLHCSGFKRNDSINEKSKKIQYENLITKIEEQEVTILNKIAEIEKDINQLEKEKNQSLKTKKEIKNKKEFLEELNEYLKEVKDISYQLSIMKTE